VTVAAGLDRARFEPSVCVSREAPWSPLSDILAAAEVPVLNLQRATRGSVWRWAPLVAVLRERRVDLLHAHMFGSNVWGTIIGRLGGVPIVVAHEHGSPLRASPLRRTVERELVARAADVLVAVSEADRQRMVDVGRIAGDKVRVIPNGIARLPRPGSDLREELGIPDDAPVIGTLTVLRPEKALDVLVDAAAVLKPRFPKLRVLIAGAGGEEVALRRQIAAGGLEQTVLLIGFRGVVSDVLAALDVAVHASDREGSPLAVLESMAAGRAIVATRVGGIPALVQHEQHALLVPPRDPTALAAAIARLLTDERLRERLGKNARRRQQARFDIQATVQALEDLYEQLFAASARGRREAAVMHPTSRP
jgi:glycosyltransferase involved in cell wall biosynthesis